MKNLTKVRRNEIAFQLLLERVAHDGMHFSKQSGKSRKMMRKLGIKKGELVALASEVAGKLAKKAFR